MWMKSESRKRYEKQEREKEIQKINELLEWNQDDFIVTDLKVKRENLRKTL